MPSYKNANTNPHLLDRELLLDVSQGLVQQDVPLERGVRRAGLGRAREVPVHENRLALLLAKALVDDLWE